MKHVIITALLLTTCGLLTFFWLGDRSPFYIHNGVKLQIENPPQQLLSLGDEAVFELHGNGLDKNTTVSMVLDASHSDAVVGNFPIDGVFNESLLVGDYLYLSSYNGGLQSLSVKDPLHPKIIDKVVDGRTINDIHHYGDYLALSQGELGVTIAKIHEGGKLDHVADMNFADRAHASSFFSGYLYVAAGASGLLVYDVSNLDKIKLVKEVKHDLPVTNSIVIGNTLFLAVGKRVETYNLNNPEIPVIKTTIEKSSTIVDLLLHQGQLYLATKKELFCYGVDFGKLELLREWTNFGAIRKIYSGGNDIYITDSFVGFKIVYPETGQLSELISFEIVPRAIAVGKNHLFLSGANKGLVTVLKQPLLGRQKVTTFKNISNSRDVLIKNNRLYVADTLGGVLVHDLTDKKAKPEILTTSRSEFLNSHRNYIFVSDSKKSLEVFDVSVPKRPIRVDFPSYLAGGCRGFIDSYMVVSKSKPGLRLVDISEISTPIVVDMVPGVATLDLSTDGNNIYIVSKKGRLLIYEVTPQATLRRLSSFSPPYPISEFGRYVAVKVRNGIAYALNWRSDLHVIDVRDPAKPTLLAIADIPGMCVSLELEGDNVIVSSNSGVAVVSVADPYNPILLNTTSLHSLSKGITVNNKLIYLANRHRGVTAIPAPLIAEKNNFSGRRKTKQTLTVKFASPPLPGRYNLWVSNNDGAVVFDGALVYKKN